MPGFQTLVEIHTTPGTLINTSETVSAAYSGRRRPLESSQLTFLERDDFLLGSDGGILYVHNTLSTFGEARYHI
jgi:hypothetical protein